MKKIINSIVWVLLGIVLLGMTSCKDKGRIVEPKDGPAHLLIRERVINLGNISRDRGVMKQEVLLINDGSETLEISSFENLCHCTHTESDTKSIRPGHGAKMTIYLNTPDLTPGDFYRTVIVHSNGGDVSVDLKGKMMY